MNTHTNNDDDAGTATAASSIVLTRSQWRAVPHRPERTTNAASLCSPGRVCAGLLRRPTGSTVNALLAYTSYPIPLAMAATHPIVRRCVEGNASCGGCRAGEYSVGPLVRDIACTSSSPPIRTNTCVATRTRSRLTQSDGLVVEEDDVLVDHNTARRHGYSVETNAWDSMRRSHSRRHTCISGTVPSFETRGWRTHPAPAPSSSHSRAAAPSLLLLPPPCSSDPREGCQTNLLDEEDSDDAVAAAEEDAKGVQEVAADDPCFRHRYPIAGCGCCGRGCVQSSSVSWASGSLDACMLARGVSESSTHCECAGGGCNAIAATGIGATAHGAAMCEGCHGHGIDEDEDNDDDLHDTDYCSKDSNDSEEERTEERELNDTVYSKGICNTRNSNNNDEDDGAYDGGRGGVVGGVAETTVVHSPAPPKRPVSSCCSSAAARHRRSLSRPTSSGSGGSRSGEMGNSAMSNTSVNGCSGGGVASGCHSVCSCATPIFCARTTQAELSVCVVARCDSASAMNCIIQSMWWLARYEGVSLRLRGMTRAQLSAFQTIRHGVCVKELVLTDCVLGDDWMQCLSACNDLCALTLHRCSAAAAVPLRWVSSILTTRQPTAPAPEESSAALTCRRNRLGRHRRTPCANDSRSSRANVSSDKYYNTFNNDGSRNNTGNTNSYNDTVLCANNISSSSISDVNNYSMYSMYRNMNSDYSIHNNNSHYCNSRSAYSSNNFCRYNNSGSIHVWKDEDVANDTDAMSASDDILSFDAAGHPRYLAGVRSLAVPRRLRCLHIFHTALDPHFIDVVCSCDTLQCLVLHHTRGVTSLAALCRLPHLRSLSLHGVNVERASDLAMTLQRCRYVRQLVLDDCRGVSDLSFLPALAHVLVRLSLSRCAGIDDAALRHVATCRRLRWLRLHALRRVSNVSALSTLKRLTRFALSEMTLRGAAAVTSAVASRLQRLDVCDTFSPAVIQAMNSSVGAPEAISSHNATAMATSSTTRWTAWPLFLSSTHVGVALSRSALTQLVSLNLAGSAVTSSGLNSGLRRCCRLRYLNLRGCAGVTTLEFLYPRESNMPLGGDAVMDEGAVTKDVRLHCSTARASAVRQGTTLETRTTWPCNKELNEPASALPWPARNQSHASCTKMNSPLNECGTCAANSSVHRHVFQPLPGNPSFSLRWLDLAGTGVRGADVLLRSLRHCRHLRFLSLAHCNTVDSLDFVSALPLLEFLDISHTDIHTSALAQLSAHTPRLAYLNVSHCYRVRSIAAVLLPTLPRLRELRLRGCRRLTLRCGGVAQRGGRCDVGGGGGHGLERVELSRCVKLGSVRALMRSFPRVVHLSANNAQLTCDDYTGNCSSAKMGSANVRSDGTATVTVCGYRGSSHCNYSIHASADIPGSRENSNRRNYNSTSSTEHDRKADDATDKTSNRDSHSETGLLYCQVLQLRRARLSTQALTHLLTHCPALTQLDLSDCAEVAGLPSLAMRSVTCASLLPKLRVLRACRTGLNNDGLSVLLRHCRELEQLDLTSCVHLSRLDGLAVAAARTLRAVNVSHTPLTNAGLAAGLSHARALRELRLRECRFVSDINILGQLPALRLLDASTTAVTAKGVVRLLQCRALEHIYFTKCTELDDVEGLRVGLTNLRTLDVYGTSVHMRVAGQPQRPPCSVM